jgi:hypothetical protein
MKEILETKKATMFIQLSGKNKSIYKKAIYSLQKALKNKLISTRFYDDSVLVLNNYFLSNK